MTSANQLQVRIDQWLWAVRIFKTRTIAADECKKGRVVINGIDLKPSRIVKVGDEITVRKPPLVNIYRVSGVIDKRVSATLAKQNYIDLTPEEELERIKLIKLSPPPRREKGAGRPTKKERRTLDGFIVN